jgi:hypothetical protein
MERLRTGPGPYTPVERLAVVFADPIRLRIVSELFLREMSPTQFWATYGGGSKNRIYSQFRQLEKYEWIRFVRKASGGAGAPESMYRATQLAIFEEETWALLPQPLREEFSLRIFDQFGERVKESLVAEVFDNRAERHFTWTPLVLDDEARRNVLRMVTDLFRLSLEEQADARIRDHYAPQGERPVHAIAGFGAFDSPSRGYEPSSLTLPPPEIDHRGEDEKTFAGRLATVFNDEINLKIVSELYLRPMSPSGFAKEFIDDSTATASRTAKRFRMLEDRRWLVQVEENTGGYLRGATEVVYRATAPAICDTYNWSQFSKPFQNEGSWRIFRQLTEQVNLSATARLLDAKPDRHLTWSRLLLDEQAWKQIIAAAARCFQDVLREQEKAKIRLSRRGGAPTILTVFFSVFEAPPPPRHYAH